MINWRKLRDQNELRTGDLLLFHHQQKGMLNNFYNMIGWNTNSNIHTGMIIKDEYMGLHVLEYTCVGFPNGKNFEYEVQTSYEPLSNVIENWKGNIYWRKLHCARNDEFKKLFQDILKIIREQPYEILPKGCFDNIVKVDMLEDWHSKKKFWCSVLCNYVYTKLGLLLPGNRTKHVFGEKELDIQYCKGSLDPALQLK